MQSPVTQLPDDRLLSLADTYHTPLYIFEESVVRDRCRELKAVLTYPNTRIRYACKALTLQAILKIMKDDFEFRFRRRLRTGRKEANEIDWPIAL